MCILTIGPSFHVHVHWIFWKLISYNGKLSFFSSTIFIPFSIFLLQNWWNYYFFMTGALWAQGNKSWFWFVSDILSMLRPLSFLFIYIYIFEITKFLRNMFLCHWRPWAATKMVLLIRFQRWLSSFLFVRVYVMKNSSWYDFLQEMWVSLLARKFCIFTIMPHLFCFDMWVGSDLSWFTLFHPEAICYHFMLVMMWLCPTSFCVFNA